MRLCLNYRPRLDPMNPLKTYLTELYKIRSTGAAVPETSYDGPLAALFNEIGKTLEPKVKYSINL